MKKPFDTDTIDIHELNSSFIYNNPAAKYLPSIKWIEDEYNDNKGIHIYHRIELEVCNLTQEQKHKLNIILPLDSNFQFDASNIKKFSLTNNHKVKLLVSLICELEPTLIIYKSFKKIGITVSPDLVNVTEMAKQTTFGEIIDLVLQASEIWPEKIVELANFYQEGNKLNEHIKTLEAVPLNNPFFMTANCHLLEFYNTLNDNSVPLSKKFKAAYNAQLPEAEFYFSELAGEKGLTPQLPMKFGLDADFITSLALVIKNKNQTIATLQPEAKISAPTYCFF